MYALTAGMYISLTALSNILYTQMYILFNYLLINSHGQNNSHTNPHMHTIWWEIWPGRKSGKSSESSVFRQTKTIYIYILVLTINDLFNLPNFFLPNAQKE